MSEHDDMFDAANFKSIETLNNGLEVTIRSITPHDKADIADAFARLDPESVYLRFFQAKSTLTEQELRAATEVDPQHIVALVVTIAKENRSIIIAGGRYIAFGSSDSRCAEIAFMVDQAYHGLGIGRRLLGHLAHIAKANSISHFEADVLSHNQAMLAVFKRSGIPMTQTISADTVHVTLSLSDSNNTHQTGAQ